MSTVNLPTVVTAGELAGVQQSVTILDVRTPAEFESEHIPGSFNVPLDQLPHYAATLRDTVNRPVVLVCRSSARARQADKTLQGTGFDGLHVLSGGIASWEAENQPLVRGAQKWDMFRQVRLVAGSLVLAFTLLALFVNPAFTWGAAAVGFGLVFSAVTNSCMMAIMLGKLPYNRGAGCDVRQVLGQIAAAQGAGSAAAD
ncbi:MAG: rhodanese-like domain-containing protein [Chloroflexota bacterium]